MELELRPLAPKHIVDAAEALELPVGEVAASVQSYLGFIRLIQSLLRPLQRALLPLLVSLMMALMLKP